MMIGQLSRTHVVTAISHVVKVKVTCDDRSTVTEACDERSSVKVIVRRRPCHSRGTCGERSSVKVTVERRPCHSPRFPSLSAPGASHHPRARCLVE